MDANFVIGEVFLLGFAYLFFYYCGGQHFPSEITFYKDNNWKYMLKSSNYIVLSVKMSIGNFRLPMSVGVTRLILSLFYCLSAISFVEIACVLAYVKLPSPDAINHWSFK